MTSQTMPMARTESRTTAIRAEPAVQVRLVFIDNLRILLVILVIVFHLAMTYSWAGTWHYHEDGADTVTATALTLFVAVNQAFFMGFYFLIAAYFVPGSLERHGSIQFLKERLLRLGVPLAVQLLVIMPMLSYALGATVWGFEGSVWTYIELYWKQYRSLDTGPLWFVEALLFFSLVYALWWAMVKPPAQKVRREGTVPGNLTMVLFATVLGVLTFVVRIWLPVGWFLVPFNFQLAHFPQYISLFVLGTIAYRRGWLSLLSEDAAKGRRWGLLAAGLIALAPVLFVGGGALEGGTTPFLGGLSWQNLAYAVWEQFVCVAMVLSLLAWFRRRHNHQGKLAREMSASAYAAYLLHTPILVLVAVGLGRVEIVTPLKFVLASLVCVPLCFAIGGLIRRLPGARRIL